RVPGAGRVRVHVTRSGQVLREACRERGLDATGAVPLSRSSNAVYLLQLDGLVARVTIGNADPFGRAERALAVARWLVARGCRAAEPAPDLPPVSVGPDAAVGFWIYYPTDPLAPPGATEMGGLRRT